MFLGCGCLIAMLVGFAPRIALIIMAIVGERLSLAYSSWIIPVLGFIFAPYTTIFYALVWSSVGGVTGWDWVWVGLGVLLDLGKWGQIYNNRQGVPGYPSGSEATV